MKVLNKSKVIITDGKVAKEEILREGVKVVDSVADTLVIDSENELKRKKNITGIAQVTPQGDKIVKTETIEVWTEQSKKKAPAKKKTEN